MGKINWKEKLSSRKFWIAVGAWVSSLLTAFNITDSIIAQVAIIISGIGALCVYIFTEGKTDVMRAALQYEEQSFTNEDSSD